LKIRARDCDDSRDLPTRQKRTLARARFGSRKSLRNRSRRPQLGDS
jgi:hypothetical protein